MVGSMEASLMPCVTQYDKKITIKHLTGSPDAHGFIDNTDAANWEEFTRAWGSVQSKGGREFWKNSQVVADVSHIWRCQWSAKLATVTPDMQLINENVVYEIISVEDVDLAHQTVEIRTKKAV
jgi:head-tail adaptor